jgi:hypothetical protein
MEILIGLLIIAIGAFCQSSCYVPINKIKDWSWESYWVVQGVFAWLILPFLGAMLAVPSGHSFFELFDGYGFNVAMRPWNSAAVSRAARAAAVKSEAGAATDKSEKRPAPIEVM